MDHVDKILLQWQQQRPDLNVEAMGIIGRVERLSRYFHKGMEETLNLHGLNMSTFDVLAALRRSGDPYHLSPSKLLASSMVTSGTMTNRIDQLEKINLVERLSNPEDARSYIISLTKKGLALINNVISEHVQTQSELTAVLTTEESEVLSEILKKFLAQIET